MKKFLFLGLGALLVASVTSCKDDSLTNAPEVLDADQTYYVTIALSDVMDSNGTRADGDASFEVGTSEENRIENVYLLFYDSNGNRVGSSLFEDMIDSFEKGLVDNKEVDGSTTYSKVGVVKVELAKGETKPTQVVAIINPISSTWTSPETQARMQKLNDLEKMQLPNLRANGKFAMSNSVYYENEYAREPIMAAQIATGKDLYASDAEAREALQKGEYLFDIYVERYAAKLKFRLATSSDEPEGASATNGVHATWLKDINDDGTTDDDKRISVELEFESDYWWLNADEQSLYVTKSFFKANGKQPGNDALSYADMTNALTVNNQGITPTWKWNDPSNYRSYWAQSPAYYGQSFPRVTDDITDDVSGSEYTGNVHTPTDFSLKYYTYNEIQDLAKSNNQYSVSTSDDPHILYVRENTMSADALNPSKHSDEPNYNFKAALPSIVMTGKYSVKENGAEVADLQNQTFYITGNKDSYYLYKATELYKLFNVKMLSFLSSTNPGSNGEPTAVPQTIFNSIFELKHPDAKTRNSSRTNEDLAAVDAYDEMIIDSRYVALQVKDKSRGNNVYVFLNNSWRQISTLDDAAITDLNRMLISSLGLVRVFNTGLAYFNIPVKHLRSSISAGNQNFGLRFNSPNFSWDAVRVGDFGIVRNHIYNVEVIKIEGLGNGINDPDDPIVPPVDEDEYYTTTRINILNWVTVPTQFVEL